MADPKTKHHSLEIERAILGGMLLDARAARNVIESHPAGQDDGGVPWFADPRCRLVYDAILELLGEFAGCDLVMLGARLEAKGKYHEVGGAGFLATLEEEIISTHWLPEYVKLQHELWLKRRALAAVNALDEEFLSRDASPAESISKAATALAKISDQGLSAESKPQSLADLSADSILELERRSEAFANGSPATGITTPYPCLDASTTGFHPGQLIVVAGRTHIGKSAFSLSCAFHAAFKLGIPTYFASLEMTKVQIVQHVQSIASGVPLSAIKKGDMTPARLDAVRRALGSLPMENLIIDDRSEGDISQWRARVESEKGKNPKLGLVVIDYLQLIKGDSKARSRVEEIGTVTRGLKRMAKDLKLPVISPAQLSRAAEGGPTDKPKLIHLRESGDIEMDADTVILLHRKSPREEVGEYAVAKARGSGRPADWTPLLFSFTIGTWLPADMPRQDVFR